MRGGKNRTSQNVKIKSGACTSNFKLQNIYISDARTNEGKVYSNRYASNVYMRRFYGLDRNQKPYAEGQLQRPILAAYGPLWRTRTRVRGEPYINARA